MRQRAGDVLGIEPLVEIDRDVDALHDLGRAAGEAAAPGAVGGARPRGSGAWRSWPGPVTAMNWLVRAVTVLFVLCLAVLGALIYRLAEPSARPRSQALGRAGHCDRQVYRARRRGQRRALSFTDAIGRDRDARRFRAAASVLVNLWATWCAPCIEEMPSLARLQAKLGATSRSSPISEDRRGAELVDPLHRQARRSPASPIYLDPKSEVGHAFGVEGLPTSILIDRDGRVVGSSRARRNGMRPRWWS